LAGKVVIIVLCAIVTDAILVFYAFWVTALIRVYMNAPVESLVSLAYATGPFLAIHTVCLAVTQSYQFSNSRNETDLIFSASSGSIWATIVCFIAMTVGIVYYSPEAQPLGRWVYLVAAVLNIFTLSAWRYWYTQLRRKRGELNRRVIVIGKKEAVVRLGYEVQTYSRSGHEIVGCVPSQPVEQPVRHGFLGHFEDLAAICEQQRADEVLVVGSDLSTDSKVLLKIVELCESTRVVVNIIPDLYDALVGRLNLYEIGGIPLVTLSVRPMSRPYAIVKRFIDVVCASTGLVLSFPILLLAIIAIRLDSPGPIFYHQTRMGLNGRLFDVIKLRTMRNDAERKTGPVWAAKNDTRITRVGKFLRKKRIDEIPQLWNVLRGDMSMVGPRPERPHFIEQFSKEVPLFPLRLHVRPGVTALSHVWGRYDSAPVDRLRYDLVYISNIGFLLDVRILFDTIKTVITGRGAQ
jgi:exopolysaccharide biosynthesis polyprenyl glycosylphosphotransferase